MTRKKAIKTIMSVTGHGDKRAASDTFDMVKKMYCRKSKQRRCLLPRIGSDLQQSQRRPGTMFLHIQNHCAGVAVCKIAA